MAAVIAAPTQAPTPSGPDYATLMAAIAAMAAEPKEKKVIRKKKILDSGANMSIISHSAGLRNPMVSIQPTSRPWRYLETG